MVFVPVGNPTGGGDPASRKGDNLYSDSVVALNASTGKMIWYYQMVHHDMWDYDVTAAPTLIDVTKGGKKIPAVAQITKQGLLFILDRMTGKPVFGVEERPVPPSTTAGEIMSPTQPFPVKPVPLARNSITPDEVSNINPQAAKYCADQVASRAGGVPFAPRNAENGTIIFPSSIGGGNWGGVSYDPALSLVFVNTQDLGSRSNPAAPGGGNGRPAGPRTAAAHGGEGGARFTDEERYPCNRPPWGRLTAVNANTGDIAWQVPLGGYKELEAKGVMGAGAANLGASMVTAGDVLFIGATNDERFRAFDARSGKQLWQVDLDGNALAEPMTFMNREGKQLLVIATGGAAYMGGVGPVQQSSSGKIIAFGLPSKPGAVKK
jgi:quinoprotein glucose dehydrogenase